MRVVGLINESQNDIENGFYSGILEFHCYGNKFIGFGKYKEVYE